MEKKEEENVAILEQEEEQDVEEKVGHVSPPSRAWRQSHTSSCGTPSDGEQLVSRRSRSRR